MFLSVRDKIFCIGYSLLRCLAPPALPSLAPSRLARSLSLLKKAETTPEPWALRNGHSGRSSDVIGLQTFPRIPIRRSEAKAGLVVLTGSDTRSAQILFFGSHRVMQLQKHLGPVRFSSPVQSITGEFEFFPLRSRLQANILYRMRENEVQVGREKQVACSSSQTR